jgi:hypothetical protein
MARTTAETIKADAQAADAALKELLTSPAPAPVVPDAPANESIPAAPPAPPMLTVVPAAPAAPAAPTPAAPAPTVQPVDPNALAEMQHRLSSLEGMYNRVDADKKRLEGQNEALTKMLQARAAAAPPTPAVPASSLITDKDRTDFGEDFVDFCTRVAQQIAHPLIQHLGARVTQLEKATANTQRTVAQVAEATEETQQERFTAEMFRRVSDWETINEDKNFLDWLQKPDTFSGTARMALLQQALKNWNAERVAAFFIAYKSESGIVTPATPPAQSVPPTPAAPAPQPPAPVDPRTLISPSSAAPAPANPNPAGGRIWTTQDVTELYDGLTKGKISRPEFEQAEAQLLQAIKEGRYRD